MYAIIADINKLKYCFKHRCPELESLWSDGKEVSWDMLDFFDQESNRATAY